MKKKRKEKSFVSLVILAPRMPKFSPQRKTLGGREWGGGPRGLFCHG